MILFPGINFQLSSCSRDNTVGIVIGVNCNHTSMIKHDDQNGNSMSYFRYDFLPDYQLLMCLFLLNHLLDVLWQIRQSFSIKVFLVP